MLRQRRTGTEANEDKEDEGQSGVYWPPEPQRGTSFAALGNRQTRPSLNFFLELAKVTSWVHVAKMLPQSDRVVGRWNDSGKFQLKLKFLDKWPKIPDFELEFPLDNWNFGL